MNVERPFSDSAKSASLKPIGRMMAAISVLAIVALLHHPVGHGNDAGAILTSIRSQAVADRIVHGSLTLIYGLLTVGMCLFAVRLGAWRFPVLLGLVSFSCAFVLLVLAAMADGFIIPSIVARCAPFSTACASQALVLLTLCTLQIEFLTRFAMVAIAIAVLSWAVALLSTPAAPKWLGILGLAAGALQGAALLLSPGFLTPHSLLFVMAGQIAWYLAVAALMMIGRAPFGAATAAYQS